MRAEAGDAMRPWSRHPAGLKGKAGPDRTLHPGPQGLTAPCTPAHSPNFAARPRSGWARMALMVPVPPPPGAAGGRCSLSLSLFPTHRPLPSPAPAAGAAPSPAPSAPRWQQAGQGGAERSRVERSGAGLGRAGLPARSSAWPGAERRPPPRLGSARLGAARLCPAESLGAQPPALLANGPERHVEIASQPGAGGADGAAGQSPARGGGSAGTAGSAGAAAAAGRGRGAARRGPAAARPSTLAIAVWKV